MTNRTAAGWILAVCLAASAPACANEVTRETTPVATSAEIAERTGEATVEGSEGILAATGRLVMAAILFPVRIVNGVFDALTG